MAKIIGNTTATTMLADQSYNPNSKNAQSGKAVAEAIAKLLGTAPENLDTLEELAKALNEDENFAAKVVAELANKVDKVDGKGLSTNDYTDADKEKLQSISGGSGASSIRNNAKGETIQLTDSTEEKIKGLNVYGKTIQDGTPTPDAPVELNSVDSVDLKISGKNLACVNFSGTHNTGGGVKITSTDVLSEVIANGTIISNSTASLFEITLKAGTYTLSVYGLNIVDSQYDRMFVRDTSTNAILVNGIMTNEPKSFTITDATTVKIGMIFIVGSSYNNQTIKMQLESGSSATEYEAYKDNSISLNTPNGLKGIPVTSGGNYTDSNGQQWICDEVDFEKGIYIQRVYEYQMKGTETIVASSYQTGVTEGMVRYDCIATSPNTVLLSCLCTHFPHLGQVVNKGYNLWTTSYTASPRLAVRFVTHHQTAAEFKQWLAEKYNSSEPITLKYILETPIETPLTEEQLTAYKSLHTYYPITNISNGEGAGMSVDYIADTKNYIDNKFAELQAMILEG